MLKFVKYEFYAIVFDVAGNQVNSKSATSPLDITTDSILVTSVTLNKTSVTLDETETVALTATASPTNAINRNINWVCSDTSVATISSTSTISGASIIVTGKKQGTVTVTATAADESKKSASCTIKVLENYVNYPINLGIKSAGKPLGNGTIPKTDWKIFYKDSTYTYIIASDYIPINQMPSTAIPSRAHGYSGNWQVSTPAETTITTSYKSSFLFNKLSSINSSNMNYRAVAYLLNTELWKGKVNTTYADACIGGPTLEMFCSSWNKEYPNQPLYYGVNSTGYTIGKEQNNLVSDEVIISDYVGIKNSLYFPHNTNWNNVDSYWLASPGASSAKDIMAIGLSRVWCLQMYGRDWSGIRPIVRLKSNVKLTLDSNDIWQLGF